MRRLGLEILLGWGVLQLLSCKHLTVELSPSRTTDSKQVREQTGNVYRFSVADGFIRSQSTSMASLQFEITEQLRYALGAWIQAGAQLDLERLEISIHDDSEFDLKNNSAAAPGLSGEREISYSATMTGVWLDPSRSSTRSKVLVMPRGGSRDFQERFFNAYGDTCKENDAEFVSISYWHHYRPLQPGCPLAGENIDKNLTVKMNFFVDPLDPSGSPPYEEIWSDDVLNAVVLVATEGEFKQVLATLKSRFGHAEMATPSDVRFASAVADDRKVSLRVLWTGLGDFSPAIRSVLAAEQQRTDVLVFSSGVTLKRGAKILQKGLQASGPAALLALVLGRDSFPYWDWGAGGAVSVDGLALATPRIHDGSTARVEAEAVATLLGELMAPESLGTYGDLVFKLNRFGAVSLHRRP
ncbi:hypothetical protein E3A20_00260 [Planctomyces bekefii]|uniref:Uncharacterized protein n=1 Tax=Planctomyces bekefii TaxID=1653850 RepID=A0A5C6MCP0_9PLAN|nr:hypothetical protein E3A20_00260 [Planctomyces bekefii]